MGVLVSPRRHIHDDSDVFYPTGDDEPLAETTLHADVILATVTTLRNYLRETASGRSPVVLCDQFVYYAKGFPALRVAPDIAVLFGVPQIPYENYKIWETEVVPSAILEISSAATQDRDRREKKALYERLGVLEYWLFDPKGEWIAAKLLGYRLQPTADAVYEPIPDGRSEALGLQLVVEGPSLGLYRLDTGEKLLDPTAMHEALKQEKVRAEQERERADRERERADRLAQELAALRQQLGGGS
ncbi:MAG: Uma2 family endonuclease [Oscillatoriales cyanobacterium SM2_1_8]|nr:Uma2 family endonuclease [Oscillatoriales cyanobacterium SM2_1_8]